MTSNLPTDTTSKPALTVNKLLPSGRGLSAVLVRRAATVELDWDVRQKSRFLALDSQGRTLAVFLPRGSTVRGQDVLVAEDGSLIRVVATPQPVMVVRACSEHGSAFDLLRAAYHLGNRHVQMQLEPDQLKLEPDHVLAAMLRRMHLIVTDSVEPFEPEAGAYAHQGMGHGSPDHEHAGAGRTNEHTHVHGDAHDDGHAHDHGHHGHEHEHGHGHAHVDDHAHAHAHAHGRGDEQAHGHRHGHEHGTADGHKHDDEPAHGKAHEHAHDHEIGQPTARDPQHQQAHGERAALPYVAKPGTLPVRAKTDLPAAGASSNGTSAAGGAKTDADR